MGKSGGGGGGYGALKIERVQRGCQTFYPSAAMRVKSTERCLCLAQTAT